MELGRHAEDRPALAHPRPARLVGTWVYETYGVKQAQEWLGHSDPATRLRHYVSLTTAARAKAVAGRCARKPPLTPPRILAAAVRLWSG